MSNSSIMSVREMIDTAFGDPEVNTVNHKLIQTILYLLARQLRLLERRVEIEVGPLPYPPSESSLSVTELKIRAMQKKKKKLIKPGENLKDARGGIIRTGQVKQRTLVVEEGKDTAERTGARFTTEAALEREPSHKSYTGESSSDYFTVETMEGRAPLDKPMYSRTEKISDDKTSSDKTSSDKTSSALTSTDKTTTDKTSSDKTSTEKTTSHETSTEKSALDKTSAAITSSSVPISSDMGTSSTVPTSSDQKPTTEFSSTDKSLASKTTSNKPSTYKSTTDKSSTLKSSTEKSFPDKTTTDKSSPFKTSSERDLSRRPSDRKVTPLKRPTTDTSDGSKRKPEDYRNLLETIEEQRERELRIIHQRTHSIEEPARTPTPMASLDSVEAKYEKLLVVERVPAAEAKARAAGSFRSDSQGRISQLSIVTQEQFEDLAAAVRKLEERFAPIGTAGFPENAQLMQELRKGASLTDAMAALQLSARLEAAEKTLGQMLSIVTDLAKQSPDTDLTAPSDQTKIIFGAKGGFGGRTGDGLAAGVYGETLVDVGTTDTGTSPRTAVPPGHKGKGPSVKGQEVSTKGPVAKRQTLIRPEETPPLPTISTPRIELPQALHQDEEIFTEGSKSKLVLDRITGEELDHALQELHDELLKKVANITTRSTVNADNAFKIAKKLEAKLDASLNHGQRLSQLETLIADYAEQINTLDTGLSSQMTNYQEQLTQMQHDLETGLENMAEVLANAGGDTAAVAELNSHFTNLQLDFDKMTHRQRELKINQDSLSLDLEALWKQIELLRETKSDREEVADALRDKAGIGALNGLVSLQQFEAVRGDFEKRICAAYDKFNNQEIVWQKAIDELLRELNEKAELIQLISLREEINKHLNMLRSRLNAMMEIVGEPRAAATTRKLHRDHACLSCSTPAHMNLEEPGKIAALLAFQAARQPAVGAETKIPKGDGDHRIGPCYPGLPIPHLRDPRAHLCQRYCGGSHTLITGPICHAPPAICPNPTAKQIATGPGTDGKIYMLDEPVTKVPCLPCNVPKTTTPRTSLKMEDPRQSEDDSDMVPSDFRLTSQLTVQPTENATPPPPMEED